MAKSFLEVYEHTARYFINQDLISSVRVTKCMGYEMYLYFITVMNVKKVVKPFKLSNYFVLI